jgi:hypothetical protein
VDVSGLRNSFPNSASRHDCSAFCRNLSRLGDSRYIENQRRKNQEFLSITRPGHYQKKIMLKRKIFAGIFSLVLIAVFGLQTFATGRPVKRIYFRRGATAAIVTGNLTGYRDSQKYLLKVRRNQTLQTVQIKSDSSSSYITVAVRNPNGDYVGDADASCNNRKEITPTVAGDYVLEVTECRKADAWRGSFRLFVAVK